MSFFDEVDGCGDENLKQQEEKTYEIDEDEVVEESDDEGEIESNDLENSFDETRYMKKIEELEGEINNLKDLNLRIRAEFDNFKKRTAKEKQGIYTLAQVDCVKEFLPLLDGLERGFDSVDDGNDVTQGVAQGFRMLIDTCSNILSKLGVESIGKKGESFNPKFHNAVKTVNEEGIDKNVVYEVLLKGYCKGDNVVRHAMVVVANP